jgi:hypothetical protein
VGASGDAPQTVTGRDGKQYDLYSHVLPGTREDAAAKVDAALKAAQKTDRTI